MFRIASINFLYILLFVIVILLNLNSFYWADDYAILNELKEFGVFKRCLNGYLTWDGRYLTPASFIQGYLLNYLPIQLITLIWTCLFLASGFLLVKILENENLMFFKEKSHKLLFYLFVILAFWFSSSKHLSQTVFWATGGVYTFNLFIGALWLYLFTIKNKSKQNLIFLVLISVLTALTTQNLILTLLIFLIIKSFSKEGLFINTLLFIILLSGLLFLNFAPGNKLRVNEIDSNLIDNINGITLFKNLALVTFQYLKHSIFLFLTLLIVIAFFNKNINLKQYFFLPKNKKQFITLLQQNIYLIVAISTIIPFILIPSLASERTSIYFVFFFILYIFKILSDSNIEIFNNRNAIKHLSFVLILTVFYSYNFILGFQLKNKLTDRATVLKEATEKTVTIKLIDKNEMPTLFRFREIKDQNDWVLSEIRKHFNCKEILIEK